VLIRINQPSATNFRSYLPTKMLRFSTASILLLSMLPAIVLSIKCYTCQAEDNICLPGRLGEKTQCKPDVKHCLKTWTVETSPKTKRHCGNSKLLENKCRDVLFGANTMLYCPCNETDFCNAAGRLHPTNFLHTFIPKHYSQPKVAFFALVLIFPSFHHIFNTIQTYL